MSNSKPFGNIQASSREKLYSKFATRQGSNRPAQLQRQVRVEILDIETRGITLSK